MFNSESKCKYKFSRKMFQKGFFSKVSQTFGNNAKSHEQIDHHVQKEAKSPCRLMVLKEANFELKSIQIHDMFYTYCTNISHTVQVSGNCENSKCHFCCSECWTSWNVDEAQKDKWNDILQIVLKRIEDRYIM